MTTAATTRILQQQGRTAVVVAAADAATASSRCSSGLVVASTGARGAHSSSHSRVVVTTPSFFSAVQQQQQRQEQQHFLWSLGRGFSSTTSGGNSNNDDDASHSDFAPQRKSVQEDEMAKTLAMIQQHVTDNPVMLYMKGNPEQPMCGFSARVIQVLQSHRVPFASVNVLNYPYLREGIKQYSQWPTIPQLYVQGEFVGGCDIVESMHASGELSTLLQEAVPKTSSEEETNTKEAAEEKK
ncbi:hypothetical protein ACA910_010473 [Epithemia clementina (nom. ined.)]